MTAKRSYKIGISLAEGASNDNVLQTIRHNFCYEKNEEEAFKLHKNRYTIRKD